MTRNGRLRVGGWISESDGPEYLDDSGPLTGEIVVDATTPLSGTQPADGAGLIDVPEPFGYRATANQGLDGMDPDTTVDGDDDGAYRGRRRYAASDRPRRAGLQRRVSIVAVAVGVLLVGTSVLARLLGSDSGPELQLGPPPTLPQADPSADSELGQRGAAPSGSPVPSGSAAPSPTDPPVQALSFEAEAAERGSHGQVVALDGASGGEAVRLSGNRDGTFVQFADVSVAEAGRYELIVFYFSDQTRTAGIAVGDAAPEFVNFPSRAEAGTVGSVTLGVQLGAGANTVVIGTDGGAPLSIDRITVSG
jgi:hypothetical protein